MPTGSITAPQNASIAQVLQLPVGSRCNLTALLSSAWPLKEIITPAFSGPIFNASFADASTG